MMCHTGIKMILFSLVSCPVFILYDSKAVQNTLKGRYMFLRTSDKTMFLTSYKSKHRNSVEQFYFPFSSCFKKVIKKPNLTTTINYLICFKIKNVNITRLLTWNMVNRKGNSNLIIFVSFRQAISDIIEEIQKKLQKTWPYELFK